MELIWLKVHSQEDSGKISIVSVIVPQRVVKEYPLQYLEFLCGKILLAALLVYQIWPMFWEHVLLVTNPNYGNFILSHTSHYPQILDVHPQQIHPLLWALGMGIWEDFTSPSGGWRRGFGGLVSRGGSRFSCWSSHVLRGLDRCQVLGFVSEAAGIPAGKAGVFYFILNWE